MLTLVIDACRIQENKTNVSPSFNEKITLLYRS